MFAVLFDVAATAALVAVGVDLDVGIDNVLVCLSCLHSDWQR